MGLVSLLFSFNGRINRAQYWSGTLGVSFINFLMTALMSSVSIADAAKNHTTAASMALSSLGVTLPLGILAFWCALALQVKRFHDRGRTGWIAAIPIALALWMVFVIVGGILAHHSAAELFSDLVVPVIALLLTGLFFFVDLCCLPGKAEPNRFGPPPGAPRPPLEGPGAASSAKPAASMQSAQSAMDAAIAAGRAEPVRAAMPPRHAPQPVSAASGPSFGRRRGA